ncbi:MAG: GGDEF domain-containing protein [Zoogloeaceae bacterium]|nr:GGDEF domain-containing protein [Zoogloeaceae bacterium]
MNSALLSKRRQLLLLLTLVLTVGFLTISLVSYQTSRTAIHDSIVTSQLPLTSDNIYSEIQKDLIRPILISALMASDTFVRDWVLRGEKDIEEMRRYLNEIMVRHGAFTSFFVSETTRNYYHPTSILKQVKEDEARDEWFFRVRQLAEPYEINMDPDLANHDALTIFINYRVVDYNNRFIGVTGVGLTADAVQHRINHYQERYKRRIYFVGTDGKVALSTNANDRGRALASMEGMQEITAQITGNQQISLQYERGGHAILLNARFIPELKWYLIVEQDEDHALADIRRSLYLNILIVLLIAGTSIWLTGLTITRYQRRLEEMAITDKLTGLANRQAFAPLIELTLSQLKRTPEPLSLILIDIDHFKGVNDEHGHLAGDLVLQKLSAGIASGLRESDQIFRWGGEEFLVILRDCEAKDALRIAEKLREIVATTSIHIGSKSLSATISLGVAERLGNEAIDPLIGRADRALYAAKRNGRNCVALAD